MAASCKGEWNLFEVIRVLLQEEWDLFEKGRHLLRREQDPFEVDPGPLA